MAGHGSLPSRMTHAFIPGGSGQLVFLQKLSCYIFPLTSTIGLCSTKKFLRDLVYSRHSLSCLHFVVGAQFPFSN